LAVFRRWDGAANRAENLGSLIERAAVLVEERLELGTNAAAGGSRWGAEGAPNGAEPRSTGLSRSYRLGVTCVSSRSSRSTHDRMFVFF
jgi:hypothetical protein